MKPHRLVSCALLAAALSCAGCSPDAALKKGEVIDKNPSSAAPSAAPATAPSSSARPENAPPAPSNHP